MEIIEILLPSWLSLSFYEGRVPDNLPQATLKGVLWQAGPERFLLLVPHVAKFLVENGIRVTIEPAPGAGWDLVRRHFLMAPLAALIYQRGQLAFHAAAALPPDGKSQKGVLIAGDSAAGKSTLLVALQDRGWRILADELALIFENDAGKPALLPIGQEILLWQDAIEQLDLPLERKAEINGVGRWVVTCSTGVEFEDPVLRPFEKIFRVSIGYEAQVKQLSLQGGKAFQAIGAMLYNSHFADVLISRQDYLRQAAMIARNASISILLRPRGRWSVAALADRIEGDVFEEGGRQHGRL